MQEPKTWDLELYCESENQRVRDQIEVWVKLIQQNYETKTPLTISFNVPDGILCPEGAAAPIFDRFLIDFDDLRKHRKRN